MKFFTYSCGFYTKIDKAQVDKAKKIILRERRAISSSQTQTLLDKLLNVPISENKIIYCKNPLKVPFEKTL